jgi:hypothetical protein
MNSDHPEARILQFFVALIALLGVFAVVMGATGAWYTTGFDTALDTGFVDPESYDSLITASGTTQTMFDAYPAAAWFTVLGVLATLLLLLAVYGNYRFLEGRVYEAAAVAIPFAGLALAIILSQQEPSGLKGPVSHSSGAETTIGGWTMILAIAVLLLFLPKAPRYRWRRIDEEPNRI